MSRLLRTACLTGIAIASGVVPALAHHPMGGATPVTFLQGLLSGFGHPVLGLDHLAALVVVGLLASRTGRGWFLLPSVWIAAMGAGVFAHLGAIDLPGAEFLVAGSLVAIALIAVVLPALPPSVMGPVFALACPLSPCWPSSSRTRARRTSPQTQPASPRCSRLVPGAMAWMARASPRTSRTWPRSRPPTSPRRSRLSARETARAT